MRVVKEQLVRQMEAVGAKLHEHQATQDLGEMIIQWSRTVMDELYTREELVLETDDEEAVANALALVECVDESVRSAHSYNYLSWY